MVIQLVLSSFKANLKNSRFQLFLGRFDGRPVATALALSENETCGVYLVSTHQDYQGQGIGRDMTLAAMTAGRKMKCEKAVLQAKASGHGVYQKIGLQNCGEIVVFDISKYQLS